MCLTLVIAHGAGLVPFMVIGVPSAIAGVILLGVGTLFLFKKDRTEGDRKLSRRLLTIGGLLIVLFFISPVFEPVFDWAFKLLE